jgi:hypothetical protein
MNAALLFLSASADRDRNEFSSACLASPSRRARSSYAALRCARSSNWARNVVASFSNSAACTPARSHCSRALVTWARLQMCENTNPATAQARQPAIHKTFSMPAIVARR